jgi:hypothetical protein
MIFADERFRDAVVIRPAKRQTERFAGCRALAIRRAARSFSIWASLREQRRDPVELLEVPAPYDARRAAIIIVRAEHSVVHDARSRVIVERESGVAADLLRLSVAVDADCAATAAMLATATYEQLVALEADLGPLSDAAVVQRCAATAHAWYEIGNPTVALLPGLGRDASLTLVRLAEVIAEKHRPILEAREAETRITDEKLAPFHAQIVAFVQNWRSKQGSGSTNFSIWTRMFSGAIGDYMRRHVLEHGVLPRGAHSVGGPTCGTKVIDFA